MKTYLILIVVLITTMIYYGCQTPGGEREDKDGYSIVVIDSCEYIEVSYLVGAQSGYYSLTHKGNCTNRIHKCAQ
jgi:hypothetical protein